MVNFDFSELFEQFWVSFNQISTINKLQDHNKHLLIVGSETDLGQKWEAKQSGVHWSNGQTKGQLLNTGRRGVVRTQIWGVGPTGVATNYHQRWWGEGWSDAQGKWLPCSPLPGVKWSTNKIHKNVKTMENTSSTDRLNTQEISKLQTTHKNQINSCHFGKNLKQAFFDFLR